MNLGVAATKGSRVHIDSTEIVAGGSGTADNGIAVTSESGISARTEIRNSTILGAVMAGNVDGSGAPAFLGISSTSINGLITETPPDGDIRCSGVFTADYTPLTCP